MGDGIGAGRLAGKGKAMAAVAMIAAGAATIALGGFGDPNTRVGAPRQQPASLGVADLTAPRPAYDRNE